MKLKRPVCWLVPSSCHSPFISMWLCPATHPVRLPHQKQTASKSKSETPKGERDGEAVGHGPAGLGGQGQLPWSLSAPHARTSPTDATSHGCMLSVPWVQSHPGLSLRSWLADGPCYSRLLFCQRFTGGEVYSWVDLACLQRQQPLPTEGVTGSLTPGPREGKLSRALELKPGLSPRCWLLTSAP